MKKYYFAYDESGFVLGGAFSSEKEASSVFPNAKISSGELSYGDHLSQKKPGAAFIAIQAIVFDHTNDYSLPNTKKAVREAVEKGAETSEQIQEYAIEILSSK